MDSTIAIVDYRAGNLTSVARALASLGRQSVITCDPATIAQAERIIFPGVGAAGEAMRNLTELGLGAVLRDAVAQGKPFLGICLGYQILFSGSDEDGGVECLGILPGQVVRFPDPLLATGYPRPLKVPHMGWNGVRFLRAHPVLEGVPAGSEFYFVHSYYPQPAQPDLRCGETDYGLTFASGVAWKSLIAFQCHPEKSGRPGLRLLDNFCRWEPADVE
jgi:glutamine amidotransferase